MREFRAKLVAGGEGDAWTRIDIPFDVQKTFGSKARVSVRVEIDGHLFHTSIFPNGDGTHHMLINKAMQKATGASPGKTVKLRMARDTGDEPDVPDDLASALSEHGDASAAFDGLTPAGRREYIGWIASAKRAETRADRVEKTMKMVLAGRKRPSQ